MSIVQERHHINMWTKHPHLFRLDDFGIVFPISDLLEGQPETIKTVGMHYPTVAVYFQDYDPLLGAIIVANFKEQTQ